MNKTKAGSVSKYMTKAGERLWRYRFNADVDPSNGKRRQIGKAGFATRSEALQAAHVAIEEYEKTKKLPAATPPARESLADWVRSWLRDYAPERCQPTTLERYHGLASYILDATEGEPAKLAATPLVEVDHKILEAALRALLRMKAKRIEHLSPKSVREIAGVLSVSLNEAFRLGKITFNPFLRVKLPRVGRTEARALTPEEVQQLREVCRGDWTFIFVEIALATGARRGELLALEWPDVDWMKGVLTISKSLEETEAGGLRVKDPKSGRSRKFRIGQSTISALQFQQEMQREYQRTWGEAYQHHGLVFSEPNGSHLRPHIVSQTIRRRVQRAGIKNASLHNLRHTHASSLLSLGVPLTAVSARLGHSDTNITARVYAHFLPDDDARAADAWENVIRNPVQ